MIDTYIKVIRAHETILLLLLAAAVIWGVSGKIENVIAKHDKSNETQAQIVATAQANKDAAVATQVAKDKADFDAAQAAMIASKAKLEEEKTALATALARQIQNDNAMTDRELAARWEVLVPGLNMTVDANGKIVVTDPAAHLTVDQLEKIPVLTQELSNSKQSEQNTDTLLGASQKQVTDLNSEVSGLNLQIVDNSKVCDARVKVETDKIHKARRRWFEFGFVTGFLARQIIKTEAGI
jgi:Na+-transporting methylmalonyl-CoA/oxaloacetate decarboxylase gamma subunit